VSVRRSPATTKRDSPQRDAQEDGAGAQELEERPAATARLAAAFVALLLAATGTLVAIGSFRGVAPPAPAGAAANGRIAYVAGDDGDVYLTDPEGGGSSRIIQRHAADHEGGVEMTWSPDGTRVAFTDWTSADTRSLYAMNADGTELVGLSAGLIDADSPAWSPDGSQIAFTGVDSEHGYEIYVVEADGTRRSRLTDEADNGVDGAYMPAWSLDGARIAYSANSFHEASQTETQAIFTMGADGSGRVQVTGGSEIDEVPVWSPDGAKIAFSRRSGEDSEVFVANADGTGLVNVSDHPALDWPASWSPDGTGILLVSRRGGDYDIYLAALDGRLARLTDHPGDDLSPVWSPDGTAIAFASDRAGSLDIYVMNADGGDVTRVTEGPRDEHSPAWLAVPASDQAPSPAPSEYSSTVEPDPSSEVAVPEGRLVVQLNSGIEVLGHEESRSISLKDERIVAYDVSPDGTKILAASYVTEPTHYTREDQLLTIDTLSGERTTLVRASPTEDLGPALWSPDGGEVAYRLSTLSVDPATEHPGEPTAQTICVVDVVTQESRCSPDLGTVDGFSWSPDGQRLVVDGVGGDLPLRVLNLSTGQVSDLASPNDTELVEALGGQSPDSFVFAEWSPSGRYVATQAHLRAEAIFDADGRFVMLGHETTEFSEVIAWSPTRDLLAYAIGRPPYSITDLYALDPTTGEDRMLFSTGRGEHAPIVSDLAWSPSGRWLAVAIVERTLYLEKSVVIIDVTGEVPNSVIELAAADEGEVLIGWGPVL
jgi:Tol biopolymer transport system component